MLLIGGPIYNFQYAWLEKCFVGVVNIFHCLKLCMCMVDFVEYLISLSLLGINDLGADFFDLISKPETCGGHVRARVPNDHQFPVD